MSFKYKYKRINGEAIVLINKSFWGSLIDAKKLSNILFINISTELKKHIDLFKNI